MAPPARPLHPQGVPGTVTVQFHCHTATTGASQYMEATLLGDCIVMEGKVQTSCSASCCHPMPTAPRGPLWPAPLAHNARCNFSWCPDVSKQGIGTMTRILSYRDTGLDGRGKQGQVSEKMGADRRAKGRRRAEEPDSWTHVAKLGHSAELIPTRSM